jgi:tRNA threonylcarbamoyladenosine biosynthesis protein TsaE
MLIFETFSPKETANLGVLLGERIAGGQVIALDGDLAAGKTQFVKGLAQGLGSAELVTSPTFALLHLYKGARLDLAHFDVYRLNRPEEMEALDYEAYFYGSGVTAVEWGSLIRGYLPENHLQICFRHVTDPSLGEGRAIEMRAMGRPMVSLWEEMRPYARSGD